MVSRHFILQDSFTRDSYFGSELYRFRNFGLIGMASYPLDRFHRMDFGLSVLSVSAENLDNPSGPNR